MANMAVKAIAEGKPLQGVLVTLSTYGYAVRAVTGSDGEVAFNVPVGGYEAGRHAEPGVSVLIRAEKSGWIGPSPFTEMIFGDRSFILAFRRA